MNTISDQEGMNSSISSSIVTKNSLILGSGQVVIANQPNKSVRSILKDITGAFYF